MTRKEAGRGERAGRGGAGEDGGQRSEVRNQRINKSVIRNQLRAPCPLLPALHFSSRPGDEAELVVLLQMGMSGQDADTEAVGAGLARRN
jgi:hypothetical protein